MKFSPIIDYHYYYFHYTRLPFTAAVIAAALLGIASCVGVILLYNFELVVWASLLLLLGFPIIFLLSLCLYSFLAMVLSPTIIRTDAIVQLKKHVFTDKTDNGDSHQDNAGNIASGETPTKENQKQNTIYRCPTCGTMADFGSASCYACGQKFDWRQS